MTQPQTCLPIILYIFFLIILGLNFLPIHKYMLIIKNHIIIELYYLSYLQKMIWFMNS